MRYAQKRTHGTVFKRRTQTEHNVSLVQLQFLRHTRLWRGQSCVASQKIPDDRAISKLPGNPCETSRSKPRRRFQRGVWWVPPGREARRARVQTKKSADYRS